MTFSAHRNNRKQLRHDSTFEHSHRLHSAVLIVISHYEKRGETVTGRTNQTCQP